MICQWKITFLFNNISLHFKDMPSHLWYYSDWFRSNYVFQSEFDCLAMKPYVIILQIPNLADTSLEYICLKSTVNLSWHPDHDKWQYTSQEKWAIRGLMSTCLQSQEVSDHRIHRESRREKDRPEEQNSEEKKIGKRRKGTKAGARAVRYGAVIAKGLNSL